MIKQLSVFLENSEGRFNKLLEILYNNNIDIRSLSIADTGDYGITRLIVDDTNKAITALKENDLLVKETRVLALEVDDAHGSLYKAVKLLSENHINVEYAYVAINKTSNKAVVIMRVSDSDKAKEIIAGVKEVKALDKL